MKITILHSKNRLDKFLKWCCAWLWINENDGYRDWLLNDLANGNK